MRKPYKLIGLFGRETSKSRVQMKVRQKSETDCFLAFQSQPSCALLPGEGMEITITPSEKPL